jgi:PPE-repeat protein
MNFAVLPPELNSARILAGAGLGPMLAAAAGWESVAEELQAAAGSFASVTSGLAADAWRGPAALAMTRAAAPYLSWLSSTAAQAQQAGAQARLAAGAFEAARAAIVHPAMVAANRSQLVSLVVSNLLGQNAPAIAAAEADYELMWAQDVAAMAGYHAGASAAVTQLAPFEEGLQQLLRTLGISVDFNTGTFNIGSGNIGVNNIGSGNFGNGNIGLGNIGDGNVGSGNHGNKNIGIGNIGNWNIGFGITGNGQIGFAAPGDGGVRVLVVGNGGPGVTAIVMGGTDSLLPSPKVPLLEYAARFITPFYPGFTAESLDVPSKFFPFTGLNTLSFDASVAQGVNELHTAIMAQFAAGNHTVVFGISQSSTIATLEMKFLQTLPVGLRPGPDELSFVLTGNPDRPDGGLFARIPGFCIPQIGFSFYGATPSNLYPTIDYAVQYDGVADFPRYPLNVFATANALAGIVFIHGGLGPSMPLQISSGIVQPVSPGSLTTYILLPTHDLPLLDPLRAIPFVGHPLADLIQPDLRVLVELGYDRTAFEDVPTPFGLFPHIDPAVVAAQLQQGAVQGINDALAGLGLPSFPQRID